MSGQLFERSYIMNNADYRSSPQFLGYIISNIIYDYFQTDKHTYPEHEYIVEKIVKYFGADNIHLENIQSFVRDYFTLPEVVNNPNVGSIPRTCLATVRRILFIKDQINKLIKKPNSHYNEIAFLKVIMNDEENLDALISGSVLFEYNNYGGDFDEYYLKLFMLLKDGLQPLLKHIDRYINNVDKDSEKVSIDSLSLGEPIIRVCSMLRIRYVRDLKYFRDITILGVFVLHIEELLSAFQKIKLPDDYESKLESALSNDFSVLTDRDRQILIDYYLKDDHASGIANNFKISTSAALKMVERAASKLRTSSRRHIDGYMSYLIALNDEDGDDNSKFDRLLRNKELAIKLLLVFSVATRDQQRDVNFYDLLCLSYARGYTKKLHIYVDNEYIKEFQENNPSVSQQDFEKLDAVHQKIIKEKYTKFGNIYIAGKRDTRDMLVNVCDKYFPTGIRPSNENDREKLKKSYKEEYDLDYVPSKPNVIASALTSRGYILCNRGTYINKSKCPILRPELINKILEYIANVSFSNIPYAVIYQHFKNDYLMSGVSNEYMLKGLLDPFVPDIYETHRDYIHKDIDNPEYENPTELLASLITSFSGEFTWNEIKNATRGYFKDHTIAAVLYEEEKYDGLLPLSNGKYIYYDDLDVSRETVKKLGHYLDNLFSTFKYNTINVSIIFSNLQIQDPSLLAELKEAGTNSFALFSFIREAYGDKYSYHRPNISRESGVEPSHYNLMYGYIKDKKSFDDNDVYTFMDYNNISRGNYANFLERDEVYKNFVRVNAHDFVSKDSFNLSDDDLDQIDVWINNYILKYEELNTANFNLYSVLPVVMHKWNKYLLSGIVRTYLADKYSVTNTTKGFLKTDFIIRRKKNGK